MKIPVAKIDLSRETGSHLKRFVTSFGARQAKEQEGGEI